MNLWHALRRECTGAWRSVRYDLATHRSAKLAGAFTEEFEPTRPPVPVPSRMVPLTGVTLLLAGGAAGAFLAISGGLAALDTGPRLTDRPNTAPAAAGPAGPAGTTLYPSATPGPVTPRRAAAPRSPSPALPPVAPPPAEPITEGNTLSPSPSPSETESSGPVSPSPSPSVSESSDGRTEGPRSRGPRTRR